MPSQPKGMFWTLLLAIFLGAADLGLLLPGLAPIARALGVAPEVAAWTATLYAIAFAAALPLASGIAERISRRCAIAAGAALFAAGCLVGGFSASLAALLAGRVLQAVGAAALLPLAVRQIGAGLPLPRRRAVWLLALVSGVAAVVAPPLGGLIVAAATWHWLFLATLPLALATAVLALVYLPRAPRRAGVPLDGLGAALLCLAAAALLLGLQWLRAGRLPLGLASVVFGALLLPNLGLWERGVPGAIFGGLLRDRRLQAACLLGALGAAVAALGLFIPLYGLRVWHLGEPLSGLVVLPLGVPAALAALFAERLADRLGLRSLLVLGFLAMAAGGFSCAELTGTVPLLLGLLLIGGGVGLTSGLPLQYLLLGGGSPRPERALDLLGVSRALGAAAGTVLYGVLLPAFPSLFAAAALLGSLGLVAALYILGLRIEPDPA